MIPVTQTLLHDPENTRVMGNCLQAAVASVLELPLEAVPHFSQFLWWPQAMQLWCAGRDLVMRGERTNVIPDRLCIVGGRSARGVAHTVVGEHGRIVWDPHPSRDGLVTITDVTWFDHQDMSDPRSCWFCSTDFEYAWAETDPPDDGSPGNPT